MPPIFKIQPTRQGDRSIQVAFGSGFFFFSYSECLVWVHSRGRIRCDRAASFVWRCLQNRNNKMGLITRRNLFEAPADQAFILLHDSFVGYVITCICHPSHRPRRSFQKRNRIGRTFPHPGRVASLVRTRIIVKIKVKQTMLTRQHSLFSLPISLEGDWSIKRIQFPKGQTSIISPSIIFV